MSINKVEEFTELLSAQICENRQSITDRVFDSVFLTKVLHKNNRVTIETDESAAAQYQVGKTRGPVQDHSTKFAWTTLRIDISFAAQELTDKSDSVTQRKLLDAKICRVEQSMRVLLERAVIRELVSVLVPMSNVSVPNREEVPGHGAITYGSTAMGIEVVQPRVYTPGQLDEISSGLTAPAVEHVAVILDHEGRNGPDVVIASAKQLRHVSAGGFKPPTPSDRAKACGVFQCNEIEGLSALEIPSRYVSCTPSLGSPWHENHVAVLNTHYLKLMLDKQIWMHNYGLKHSGSHAWEAQLWSNMAFQWIGRDRHAIIKY